MSLSTENLRFEQASGAQGARTLALFDYSSVPLLFMLTDVALILGLSVIADFSFSTQSSTGFEITRPLGIGILAAAAFVLANISGGLYKPWRMVRLVEETRAALVNWTFAILLVATVIFCLKVGDSTSRLSTGFFAVLGFVALPASRWALGAWLRRAIRTGAVRGRPSMLIGDAAELEKVVPSLMLMRLGLDEVRRFGLSAPTPGQDGSALTPADADALKSALQFARQNRIGEIVLAMPWSDIDRLNAVRAKLRSVPLPVKLLPDDVMSELLDAPRVDFGASIAIEVQRAPLSRFELAQKRSLDLFVASIAILLLLPLSTIIAAAIKLDSRGPVIFRQRRNGFGGREFTIFKFRSMTVMEDDAKVVQAQRHDKRVTRVGRFLRASSLDELPQLLNVLLGQMSIVGPRPHAIAHDGEYSKLISGYAFRHHVKPGITGWAQVQGLRGETPELRLMERRIEMDLWYINNWSVWLDLRIMLRTFVEVFRNDAY